MTLVTILRLVVHLLFLAFFYRFLYSIVKVIERDLAAADASSAGKSHYQGPAGE